MCCEGNAACEQPRCLGPCESEELLPSSAGCSFIANRQLHLVDGLLAWHGIEDEREEWDSLVIANPSTELIATVQAYFIPEGQDEEQLFEDPDTGSTDPITLAPGELYEFKLTNDFAMGEFTVFRAGGMYRVEADAPIIAYQHSPYRAFVGNDSSLLLPENTLGNRYVVASYNPHSAQAEFLGRPSYFEMIAIEDGTQVSWLAQFRPTSGNGLPIETVERGEWSPVIKMNRFETLRVTASYNHHLENPDKQDVSGTVIESNKPIWVMAASRCSRVPRRFPPESGMEPVGPELGFCDPLQELLIPIRYWGDEYVLAHAPPRGNERHYWRIYGGEEGATVEASEDVEGLPYTFRSVGDFVEVSTANEQNVVLTADGVFMPVGYMQSRHKTGELPDDQTTERGDPSMWQLIPVGQWLSRYVFVTGKDFTQHYVQVTRSLGGPDVLLDGDPVDTLGNWTWEAVGDYEVITPQISEDLHTIESEGDFGIIQFGVSSTPQPGCEDPLGIDCNSTYAYPGGMKAEPFFEG